MISATVAHFEWSDGPPSAWATPWAEAAATGGNQIIRFDMSWRAWSPAILNDTLVMLRTLGLKPMVILGDSGPNWAPPDPWLYAKVAVLVAALLQPGEYLEVWNEPNQAPQFWNGPTDPIAYARLVWLAGTAIKAVDPKVNVVAGAIAFNDQQFIKAFLAEQPHVFDLLSIHPYTLDQPPDRRSEPWSSFVLACDFMQSLELPWAISEIGWSVMSGNPLVYDADLDARAASFYRAARAIAEARGCAIFTSFELGDRSQSGESPQMALLNNDLSPRLSFAAAAGR
jgi:hypothetical protein